MPEVKREMININAAKRVGVLYNATRASEIITVTQFAEKLKAEGKEIYIFGYQNDKNKEDIGLKLFNKNSVNFFGVPNDARIDGFQKIDLDILICAFKEECLPLEYIAATSKAKFRVGAFNKNKTNFFELMINTGENKDLLFLLQQTLHFLKVINKDDK